MHKANDFPTTYPVTSHTDYVGAGSTFVAVQGTKENGVAYIPTAIERGATTIVVDEKVQLPEHIQQLIATKDIVLTHVPHPRRALAELSAQALDYPANKLKLIAVTGTKGKTTTTFLIEHMLRTAGYKTAMLSSVRNKIGDQIYEQTLTTQQPDYLHVFFNLCVEQSVEYVVIEVSAQAVTLERVRGLAWDGFIWTNFSMEHGEFYAHMNDYFIDKRAIQNQTKPGAPIILNADDMHFTQMHQAQAYDAFSCEDQPATYQVKVVSSNKHGITIDYSDRNEQYTFSCPALIGTYNAYNIAAAVSMALKLKAKPTDIAQALMTFEGVPGRLERYILPNGALCIIDLANNPAAFNALLPTLKNMFDHMIVVFGCGGDRDAARRPIMGEIAASYADRLILTTDNPRSEHPQDIINQILAGISQEQQKHIIQELDREAAIKKAYVLSTPTSVVALLGKGAEQYQLSQGVKYYFSERQIVQALL